MQKINKGEIIVCKNNIINIQNGEALDWDKVKTLKDSAMLKHRPDLWVEWDFEKNEESGFDIYNTTKATAKKVWWHCSKCKSSYCMVVYDKAKNKKCSYCTGRKANHTNSLASLNPTLASEWHPTKNGELTPHDVTYGSSKRAWWLGECGHEWDALISSRSRNGRGCPYCTSQKVNHTNSLASLNPNLAKEWNNSKNGALTPNDVTCSSGKKVWWVCELGHEWEAVIGSRNQGCGCPYCAKFSKIITKGLNDIWTTNPELGELLLNPDDGYKYSQGSEHEVYFKCYKCNSSLGLRKINDIKNRKVPCGNCREGISSGEKFVYTLLNYLNYEFIFDKTTPWSQNRRYDFYIPSLKCIIETHGIQHYEEGFQIEGARTLAEEQANDRFKHEMAIANGIEHYIVLDFRDTSLRNMINELMVCDIINIGTLNADDFNSIYKESQKPILKIICDIWNNEGSKNTKLTSEILGLGRPTVVKYLKKGVELGLVDYVPGKKVYSK